MTSAQIAAHLATAIKPEVERLLREQFNTIADLEQRLSAANDRATAAESRLGQLREVLGATTPVKSAPTPGDSRAERAKIRVEQDAIIAAFHERRRVAFTSITELSKALGLCQSNASDKYNRWCKKTGNARINYHGNGQRVAE